MPSILLIGRVFMLTFIEQSHFLRKSIGAGGFDLKDG